MAWRAAIAGLESATGVCAALNLAYFFYRTAFAGQEALARRVAAFVLALVCLGVLAESVFVLGSIWLGHAAMAFASGEWAFVRVLAFAGMLLMSLLVLRRIGR